MRFDSNALLDLLARSSSFGRRSTERLSDTQLARNADLVQSRRWKRVPDGARRWAWAGRAGCLPSPPIKLALVGKQRLRSFHANQPVRVRDPGQQRPAPPPLEASVFHLVVRAIPCSHLPLTSPVHSSRFASGKTRTVSSPVPIHTIIPTQWGTYYAHASVRARAIPSTSEDHQFFIPRNPCAFFLVAFVAGPTCRVGNLACLMFRSSSSPCLVSRLSNALTLPA